MPQGPSPEPWKVREGQAQTCQAGQESQPRPGDKAMRMQARSSTTMTVTPGVEGWPCSEGLTIKRLRRLLVPAVVAIAFVACSAAPAFAGSVWWGLNSGSWPSNLPPEGIGRIVVNVQNRGYASASGEG